MKTILVTGGAGFIGSNLTMELQRRYPDSRITIVDDFRSGSFKNLQGYNGDLVCKDISRMDWDSQFGSRRFDAAFHLASISDTTIDDQQEMIHDNVEGFRRMLTFLGGKGNHFTPVVYASSAATYGTSEALMAEGQSPSPSNAYAFSKVQLDNLARSCWQRFPNWKITGLRYFNVYGRNEAHKFEAASMIYQLYLQMKNGERPRIFRSGQQKRDFVYIKDVVNMTILAMNSRNNIYNCGSGQTKSFNGIVSYLNDRLGTRLVTDYIDNPYSFYQPHTEADMTLAKEELGFEPSYAHTGISEYITSLESTIRISNKE